MSLKTFIMKNGHKVLHFINTNKPDILTGIAVAGVVVTAVSSVVAYKKTKRKIADLPDGATRSEKFKSTWYYWLMPGVAGMATIASTLGINETHKAKELRMIASYNILKETSEKMKQYTIEEIGKNKYKKIESKAHADILGDRPDVQEAVKGYCNAEYGGALFFDRYSGQIFPSTYEQVYKAVEKVNMLLRPWGKGGRDWVSWADFLCDCGGEYSEACERWGFTAKPFGDAIDPISKADICDPHMQEHNGHLCTVVYLEPGILEDKDFL